MDSPEAGSLRSSHRHARSRFKQRMALPHLRIRALPPRQRNEKEWQPVRNAVLCLQPMQRHVPKSDSVQCIQHRSAQHRVPADRYAASAPEVGNVGDEDTGTGTVRREKLLSSKDQGNVDDRQ